MTSADDGGSEKSSVATARHKVRMKRMGVPSGCFPMASLVDPSAVPAEACMGSWSARASAYPAKEVRRRQPPTLLPADASSHFEVIPLGPITSLTDAGATIAEIRDVTGH